MGISSNVRYQLLGGTDRVLALAMPIAAYRVYSTLIRGFNNVVGGISFVTLARVMGVQKSAVAAPPTDATPAVAKGSKKAATA